MHSLGRLLVAVVESAVIMLVIGVLLSLVFWGDWRFWSHGLGWEWWLGMGVLGVPSILARDKHDRSISAYSK